MADWINATGDIVRGDVVRFTEAVWPSFTLRGRKRPLGNRTITAEVITDSYGEVRGTHTFSLRVIEIEGMTGELFAGSKVRRKARTIYGADPMRQLWEDESKRDAVAREKHQRGDAVRAHRAEGGYDRQGD